MTSPAHMIFLIQKPYEYMAGKNSPKMHPLLSNQMTYAGYQVKAKLPPVSLACVMEGHSLIHKKILIFKIGLY